MNPYRNLFLMLSRKRTFNAFTTQGQCITGVIYVGNPQKSCVEVFSEVLSVRNVFPVLLLVGNVVRVVSNRQHLRILQFGEFAVFGLEDFQFQLRC